MTKVRISLILLCCGVLFMRVGGVAYSEESTTAAPSPTTATPLTPISPIGGTRGSGTGIAETTKEEPKQASGEENPDAAEMEKEEAEAAPDPSDLDPTGAGPSVVEAENKIWSVGPGLKAPREGSSTPKLDEKVSLDLRDIDLLDILRFLAIQGNLNVVGGKNVTGTVTLLLNDVSVGDALHVILSLNRMAYAIEGNILRVMTEEEYKALHGKPFYDRRETKIVRLKYAAPKNVGAMLEHVKSEIGRIVYDDSTGTIIMIDTPERIAQMEQVIEREELPTVTRVLPTETQIFNLQYASAADVAKQVAVVLSPEIGKSYVDERSNKFIVTDLPHKLEEVGSLVLALDTKTREVFVQAKIVQVDLSDRYQAGVQWANLFGGALQQNFPLGATSLGQATIGSIAPTTTTDAEGNSTTTFNNDGIVLQFLETYGKTSVLSTPQIAAVEGKEARIMVGTKEAYTTSSVTLSQAASTTTQNITFIDVGVTLTITPKINDDGFITMKIKPEVSSVTRFLTTSQGDQVPIVETTNAETTVMVRDGATIVIGGLMKTSRITSRSGVPVLSRIPVIGNLARSTDSRSNLSELIVLLTPHLMTGEEVFSGIKAPSVAKVELSTDEPALEETVKKRRKGKYQR